MKKAERANPGMSSIDKVEAVSKMYLEESPYKLIEDKLLRIIARRLLKFHAPGDCCELGVGSGAMTGVFLESMTRIHVVDGSSVLLSQLKSRYGDRVTCTWTLLEDWEPMAVYDTIFASLILSVVSDPQKLLEKCRKGLKPEGRLVVSEANCHSIHKRIGSVIDPQVKLDELTPADLSAGRKRVYHKDTLIEEVQRAGFAVSHVEGAFVKMVPNSMMAAWPDDLLNAACIVARQYDPDIGANIIVIGH